MMEVAYWCEWLRSKETLRGAEVTFMVVNRCGRGRWRERALEFCRENDEP